MSNDVNNLKVLEEDLIALVAKHASWLSGREFQQVTALVAQGYFPEDELDPMLNVDDFSKAVKHAVEMVFHGEDSDSMAVDQV